MNQLIFIALAVSALIGMVYGACPDRGCELRENAFLPAGMLLNPSRGSAAGKNFNECCALCKAITGCNTFSYNYSTRTCFFWGFVVNSFANFGSGNFGYGRVL